MRIHVSIVAVALVCSATLPVGAQRTVDVGELDRAVIDELRERAVPGAAIAVVVGDRVVFARGYGVRSIESNDAVTTDTVFRMGSTTKMFTAAAVVTLAERGKLALQAPIGERITGLDPAIGRITPHTLLSQSSGLRDFAATMSSHDDAALGQGVRTWKPDAFFTEPGRIYSYSSPGYWLAGYLAEQVHGKPYADTMDDLLFTPLGMKRTTLRPLVAATYQLAVGHDVKDKTATVVRPLANNVAMWPGGSMYSSIQDLSRFAMAMMNGGRLHGSQAMASSVVDSLATRHVRLPGANDISYGYGLMIYTTGGVTVVTHGGASRGYGSTIQMVPAQRFAVIVLANSSGETLPKSREKAMQLAVTLTPETNDTTQQSPAPVPDEPLSTYAGRYVHAPEQWEFSIVDGRLALSSGDGPRPLRRTAAHTFASESRPGEVYVFVPGKDGRIEHLFMGLYSARKSERKGDPPGRAR